MSAFLIVALIIVGFFGFCAITTMILVSIGPPKPGKLDFQSRFDDGITRSLRVAPYIFTVATAISAILSLWVSPQIEFLAVAGFSAVGVFISRCFHWRIRSSTTGLLTALAWLVPYLAARRIFQLPKPALLPLLQYVSVTIAVTAALTWLFRSKLKRMRRTP